MQHWPAPCPARPVDAQLRLPGSKSLTNRYLVLAALADGPSILRQPLHSRDSTLMVQALQALGATVREVPGDGSFGPDLHVEPLPASGSSGRAEVDCGLAGTVMRFVPPLAALRNGDTVFDGDLHARNRPMSTALDALRSLGVNVVDDADTMPFTLVGTGRVRGGTLHIDAGQSSQFVSALLLAGARFTDGLALEHTGATVPSPEHIAMTVQVLRSLGVEVDDSTRNQWRVSPGPISAFDVDIEQDLSNAGPFLAAAVVTGGRVRIPGWPASTTQIGERWRTLLPQFGATVSLQRGELTVSGTGRMSGGVFDSTGELAPAVAALCALAEGPSRLSGIAHLRGHETDRLAGLAREINALGGDVEETTDGLFIRPAKLHGGVFHTYEDHRMAMAGAILGLAVPGISIENIATTAKTMPEFADLWTQLANSASVSSGAQ